MLLLVPLVENRLGSAQGLIGVLVGLGELIKLSIELVNLFLVLLFNFISDFLLSANLNKSLLFFGIEFGFFFGLLLFSGLNRLDGLILFGKFSIVRFFLGQVFSNFLGEVLDDISFL